MIDFEKLYETYYMQVFSFLMTLSKSKDISEEITQNTFFKAFNNKTNYRGESNELTWLCSIAKNLFYDEMRKSNKFCEEPNDFATEDCPVEKASENGDSEIQIHRILHTLEEPYKEVFQLRVFGELSFKDIGTIFSKTENWARVTYHRARLKIQERMDENEIFL